jgi:hypothetical protein
MVTTVDFGASYFVLGELATAAGLSSLSLVAGPIAYFAHEVAWHYYGPASARHPNPLRPRRKPSWAKPYSPLRDRRSAESGQQPRRQTAFETAYIG